MRVQDNEFPVVMQAFDTRENDDVFVAEQVVSTQSEVDSFTSRYAGKLIKVHAVTRDDVRMEHLHQYNRTERKRGSGAGVLILVLLVLIALVVAGFTTGWIQRNIAL